MTINLDELVWCGECKYFIDEDTLGQGYCNKYKCQKTCSGFCDEGET